MKVFFIFFSITVALMVSYKQEHFRVTHWEISEVVSELRPPGRSGPCGGLVPQSLSPRAGQTWCSVWAQHGALCASFPSWGSALWPHEGFCCACGCASVSLNVQKAWAKLENSELLLSILNALERTLGMGAVPTGKAARTLFQSSGCDMKKQVQFQISFHSKPAGKMWILYWLTGTN